jgi:hypothetical protein
MRWRALIVVAAALPSISFAQSELTGKDQFPQFRSLSGLVGGLFGVMPNGDTNFHGAMALSTPIAYSLGSGRFAFGIANTSGNSRIRFFDRGSGETQSNGTAEGMVGLGTPVGNFTVGGMILSARGDNVLNLHFSPKLNVDRFGFGVGVQDAFNTGGSSGEALDLAHVGGISRSLYAVATAQVAQDAFVSVGTGTRRFKGIFVNGSAQIVPHIKALAEYDTFNWNYGIAGDIGRFHLGNSGERPIDIQTTAYVGYVRGKYITWGLTFSF